MKSPVRTVFIALAVDGTQTGNCAGVWGLGNKDMGFRFSNKSTSLESGGGYVRPTDPQAWVSMDGTAYGNSSVPLGAGTPRVLSFRFDADCHTEAYMADVLGLGQANPSRTTVVGCYSGNPAFAGSIGEVIAYNRTLTDDEMRRVERYLIKKWKETEWTEGNPPTVMTAADCGLADGALTLVDGAEVTLAGGASVGTVSGGGTLTGDLTVTDGFAVTVKSDGTTDTLAVDGVVTLGADAFLQVYNPKNLQNGVFGTFLTANSITGTFAGTNLEKPGTWSVTVTSAKVYKSTGTVLIFR